MVKYKYDAWGNHKAYDNNDCTLIYDSSLGVTVGYESHIGNLNPFRYRSYYFDTEAVLYFLQSRYYDPEVGRFISQDDVSYLDTQTVNGINLYAYCLNNPVMYTDGTGCSPDWGAFFRGLGRVVTGVLAVVAGALVIASGAHKRNPYRRRHPLF